MLYFKHMMDTMSNSNRTSFHRPLYSRLLKQLLKQFFAGPSSYVQHLVSQHSFSEMLEQRAVSIVCADNLIYHYQIYRGNEKVAWKKRH